MIKRFLGGIRHCVFKVLKLTGSHFRIPAGGCDVVAVAGLAHDPVGKKWDPGILDPGPFPGQIRKVGED